MAKTIVRNAAPVDEPILLKPGVMHREADYFGNAKYYTLPPEHPLRAEKGDLGMSVIPGFEPRHSFESNGLPYTNLRKR